MEPQGVSRPVVLLRSFPFVLVRLDEFFLKIWYTGAGVKRRFLFCFRKEVFVYDPRLYF